MRPELIVADSSGAGDELRFDDVKATVLLAIACK